VTVNGRALETSDGVAVSDEPLITVAAESPAEVMLFDLA
jgi:redox-sensitive bicupin YhaK (pirin superfamily)